MTRLFDPSGFPARWQCGSGWASTPWLGWLHILSDLGVWSAYFAIPLVLGYFLLRRRDLPFRSVFALFVTFILLCGTTHLMEAIIFWWPVYRLAGVIKLLTAVVSWVTLFALIRVAPTVVAMRTPEELEREVIARKAAERLLLEANANLERLVEERTSELTRTVAEIQQERERLRTTLASIGDGVITTDEQGRITNMNPVAEALTGWANADAVGHPLVTVFSIVNEDTREPVENPATRALNEGVIVGLANHTILIARDGTERPIDDSAAPIRTKDGDVAGCILVFRDITNRKRAENEQRTTEEQFRRSILRSPIPIIVHSENDAILHVSEGWTQFSGYTIADIPTIIDWTRLAYGERQATLKQTIDNLFNLNETDHTGEFAIRAKDGTVRVWDFYTTPLGATGPGEQRLLLSTAIDITERKEAEMELRRLAAQLSEADHRKDEFLATLAHELRNPLAPVRNALELMKLAKGDPELVEQSRFTMERQIGQMVRLIDDLMDVSRITRNRLELRKERVELASIIHQAVEANRPLCARCHHELSVVLPPAPTYLDADPSRLAQVFGNLLTNACKFTASGGRISLQAERQGAEIVVTVTDNGIGIAAEMLPKIFDMFTQVSPALDRTEGGLGIGLSLVKRLVEMHDGTVTAHSPGLGFGSEFVVRLPALIEQPRAENGAAPQPEPPVSIARRILVVDDNRDAALTLAMLLKMTGNETQTAHDGVEAIEKAASSLPDVILLDIGLPKMNGYEVCSAIRQQPWGKRILMIALTGWGQDEDRRKSAEAGFDSHLVKPVDHMALMKLLAGSPSAE